MQATVLDGCDPATQNGILNLGEIAHVSVRVQNDAAVTITGLTGSLVPAWNEIIPLLAAAPAVLPPTGLGPGDQADIVVPVHVRPTHPCDAARPLRFRMDIEGDDGFRDRVWFDLPQDCTASPLGDSMRPGEVPHAFGAGGVQPLLVSKGPGSGNSDLLLSWSSAPGALRHDIYTGDIATLWLGTYSHAIELDSTVGVQCNMARAAAEPQSVAIAEGPTPGIDHAGHYYFVVGETDCGSGAIEGTSGFADEQQPYGTLDVERPPGALREPACLP